MPIDATTKVTLPTRWRALAIPQAFLQRAWHKKRRTGSASRSMLALAWTTVIAFCLYAALATVIYVAQRSAVAVEIHNDRFGVARRHVPGRNAHTVRRGQRNLFRFGKSRFGRHDMGGVREIHQ